MKVQHRKTGLIHDVLIFKEKQIVIQIIDKFGIIRKVWLDTNKFNKYWNIIK